MCEADDYALELSRVLNPGVPDVELPGMVMVGVYVDESEDLASGVFTLAGWVAPKPEGWGLVTAAWRDMVAKAPHPIKEFHMTDIAQRDDDFADEKGWSQPERDALVKRATDILVDGRLSPRLMAFGCSVVRSGMEWHHETSYDLYKVCYQVLMVQLVPLFSEFHGFDFVFDEKEKVRKHVNDHFFSAKEELDRLPGMKGMLGGASFQPSHKVLPLQAADFIAYERRKRHSDRLNGHDRRRKCYERLCERPQHFKILDHRYNDAVNARAKEWGRTEDLQSYELIPDDVD